MIETTATRITGTVVLTGELELVVDEPACYNLLTKVFVIYIPDHKKYESAILLYPIGLLILTAE